jgi:hypothetical protein
MLIGEESTVGPMPSRRAISGGIAGDFVLDRRLRVFDLRLTSARYPAYDLIVFETVDVRRNEKRAKLRPLAIIEHDVGLFGGVGP